MVKHLRSIQFFKGDDSVDVVATAVVAVSQRGPFREWEIRLIDISPACELKIHQLFASASMLRAEMVTSEGRPLTGQGFIQQLNSGNSTARFQGSGELEGWD